MSKLYNAAAIAVIISVSGPAAHGQIAAKGPEPATLKANAESTKTLPFANRQDFDDAMRGFIGTTPDALVTGSGPRPVWSMKPYDFLKQNEPVDSVNPSLWRQAQLNGIHGLFKVTDRVYQVRGFDIANMTIIEGNTSLIIIDPLTTTETAHAALELYYQHRPKKRVGTVIYSHNHGDHFGGVKGVISEADVAVGKVRVLAVRVHGSPGGRQLSGRQCNEPTCAVPVRRCAAAGTARSSRFRVGQEGGARHGHPDRADRHDQQEYGKARHRWRGDRVSARAWLGGTSG